MSKREIDTYIARLEEPKRTTLTKLRNTIETILPDAEQGISYGMPAFKVHGKVVAGFAAFKNHLGYLPHSGSVVPAMAKELADYTYTSGALHFPIDRALPKSLVRKLIAVLLRQIED